MRFIPGMQNSNIYIYVHFQIIFHCKLLQDNEYSPECKTSVLLEETYEIF